MSNPKLIFFDLSIRFFYTDGKSYAAYGSDEINCPFSISDKETFKTFFLSYEISFKRV